MLSRERSRRKISGGLFRAFRKKKNANLASVPTATKVSEFNKVRVKRGMGGKSKPVLLFVNKINVMDPKSKKAQVTEISSVVESPADRNFIRRNIITKGAVLSTKLGKVRVTSRPGQEGMLNGILLKD